MPDQPDWDLLADDLGARAVADGEPTRWYEELWSAGARGEVSMPFDRTEPYDLLASWSGVQDGDGRRAAVVGAGYGADAEHLARHGFAVTAFDISPTAVDAVRARYPSSVVDYRVADLLALPEDLVGAFDVVVEIFTLQALHSSLRPAASAAVRSLVAPGGSLLVVQVVREDDEEHGPTPPWPLTRAEVEAVAGDGLTLASLERIPNAAQPDRRDRWRAVFTSP